MANFMSETKKSAKAEEPSKKTEVAVTKKKSAPISKPSKKQQSSHPPNHQIFGKPLMIPSQDLETISKTFFSQQTGQTCYP